MNTVSGSSAAKPDLDWSQLRETILMLNLAIAQIDQSMNEGSASVSTLSHSFTSLATNLADIQTAMMNLEHKNTAPNNDQLIIRELTTTTTEKVHSSIIAFQFYDKLNQRLEHVSQSLSDLATLIADPASLYSPLQWQALQNNIKSKYTMEEERRMFDNVISGMPVKQALEVFKQERIANQDTDDDIELF